MVKNSLNTYKKEIRGIFILCLTLGVMVISPVSSNSQTLEKVIAPTRDQYYRFGSAVAIDGTYALVGSKEDHLDETDFDDGENNAGSAFFYEQIAGNWTMVNKVVASDRDFGDFFGSNVSLDGNYAAISASGADINKGWVYVFYRNAGVWAEQQKIVPADANFSDLFGKDLDITGSDLIMGAYQHDYDEFNADSKSGAGAAYIYTRSGTTWSLQQKICQPVRNGGDNFGTAVAISGDYAFVSAPLTTVSSNANTGEVYVFKRVAGVWSLFQTISGPVAGCRFGSALAVEGNHLLISTWTTSTVYAYEFDPSVTMSYTEDVFGTTLTAGGETDATELISNTGGSATWGNGNDGWSFQDRGDGMSLTPFDISGSNITTLTGATLKVKYSVEPGYGGNNPIIYNASTTGITPTDGDVAVVATFDLYAGGITTMAQIAALNVIFSNNDNGSADGVSFDYMYLEITGTTTSAGYGFVNALTSGGGGFGVDVSIYDTTALIGAYNVTTDTNGLNPINGEGAAHLFRKAPGGNWSEVKKLVSPDASRGPGTYNEFGWSVGITTGEELVIGAWGEDEDLLEANALNNAGAAYFKSVIILPVELITFKAKPTNNKEVTLIWQTASEINNDYFEIERSDNGVDFEKIGKVLGKGNSNQLSNYTYLDKNPLDGTSYYRLKQTDFDGKFSYSNIEAINLFNLGKVVTSIYPNPFETGFTVQFSVSTTFPLVIEVYSCLGRKVHTQVIEENTVEIDFDQQLPKGTYYLKVVNQNQQHFKLIKLK